MIEKRRSFLNQQRHLDPKRLVFLDESGFRLGAPPHYGWAPCGEKSPGKSVQGSWQTMTMLGAISLDGFRGFLTIDAATDSEIFTAFVRHQLAPNLRPGDIVVMDNLSAHKNEDALAALREVGATALFLPPYSPALNPDELVWNHVKTHHVGRAAIESLEHLKSLVLRSLRALQRSPQKIQAFFREQHVRYASI